MANKITNEEIIEINELYLKLGTYAAVAREVGRAGSTVKKYIIPDYVSKENIVVTQFDKSKLKDIEQYIPSRHIYNAEALMHTEEELKELEEFRKELSI